MATGKFLLSTLLFRPTHGAPCQAAVTQCCRQGLREGWVFCCMYRRCELKHHFVGSQRHIFCKTLLTRSSSEAQRHRNGRVCVPLRWQSMLSPSPATLPCGVCLWSVNTCPGGGCAPGQTPDSRSALTGAGPRAHRAALLPAAGGAVPPQGGVRRRSGPSSRRWAGLTPPPL